MHYGYWKSYSIIGNCSAGGSNRNKEAILKDDWLQRTCTVAGQIDDAVCMKLNASRIYCGASVDAYPTGCAKM